jgi:putative chitinase
VKTVIDAKILRVVAPECANTGIWIEPIQRTMDIFHISENADRVAAFLAHVAVESAGFNRVRENLNYTTPQRICEVWPKRFPTVESALPYVRNPDGLANFVYSNRLGNGSAQSNDGWNFRGGGLIMTTGRANFSVLESMLALPFTQKPELLTIPVNAAMAAGYFWDSHSLNQIADATAGVSEYNDFLNETEIINGGRMAFKERWNRFVRVRGVLV